MLQLISVVVQNKSISRTPLQRKLPALSDNSWCVTEIDWSAVYLSTSACFLSLSRLFFNHIVILHLHTKDILKIDHQVCADPFVENYGITLYTFKAEGPLRFEAVKYFKSSFGHAGMG